MSSPMSHAMSPLKGAQLSRLFELIRQENLANKIRRRADEPLSVPRAESLLRSASASLSPAQAT